MTLQVSNLVNVQVVLTPTAAQGQNLNTLLIIGDSNVIPPGQRIRYYSSLLGVESDFGRTAPEYLSAQLYFAQVPTPAQLAIGRWTTTNYAAVLTGSPIVGDLTAYLTQLRLVTTGSLAIPINGTTTPVTGINLSTATSLTQVATLLTTAVAGVTFTWTGNQFIVTTTATGATATIAPATGTGSLDGTLNLTAAAGAVSANGGVADANISAALSALLTTYGNTFFGVSLATTTAITDTDRLSLAGIVQADQSHILGLTTNSAAVIDPTSTADFAYQLANGRYSYTFVQWSSSSPYADASFFGRALTVNYGGNNTVITLMYKQEPLIQPENLTQTQANALRAKNVNVLAAYNTAAFVAIIQYGTVSSGDFFDTIAGLVWLKNRIQLDVFNLLYTSPTKVPQTDTGVQLIVSTVEASCYAGVVNGLLAPGVWTAPGFGSLSQNDYLPKGYYVFGNPIGTQSQADRAMRLSPPIQVAVKLAGAIHLVNVIVNVNR